LQLRVVNVELQLDEMKKDYRKIFEYIEKEVLNNFY